MLVESVTISRHDFDAAIFDLDGVLTETARVHDQNRLLVRQELSFLDHLMRLLSGTPQSGYSATGGTAVPQIANAVNAHA